tara:strand:- start:1030 stop:1761 length:732 start_codon:yes stop_codon:yes gene_type:complete
MANKKAKIELSETNLNKLTATIRDLGKSDTAAQKVNDALDIAKVSVVDQCREMGLTSSAFVTPKNGGTLTAIQYDKLKTAVVKGYFPQPAIAMLQADPKALAKGEAVAPYRARTNGNRRYWQMQIGSRMNDVKGLLARSETKAQAEKEAAKEAKKPQATKDREERKEGDIQLLNVLTMALYLATAPAKGSIANSWDEEDIGQDVRALIQKVASTMSVSSKSEVSNKDLEALLKKNVTDKLKSK